MKRGLSRVLLLSLALPGAVALAESRMEKTLKLDPGNEFIIDTDLGRVTVTGASASGVRLVVTSRRELDDLLHFEYEEGSGRAMVRARKKHSDWGFFSDGGSNVRFEIEVPAQTTVRVHTSGGAISLSGTRAPANLHTSGGGIEVRGLQGDLEANTSGGSISIRDIRGKARVETSGGGIDAFNVEGTLQAETSGGSIHTDRITGDMRVHSSGGGIHIREAGGKVEADTSGGSIDAEFSRGNSRGGSLESSGGGITVAVDPSVGLAIDARGNSVSSDVPLTVQGEFSRGSLRGNLGSGGERLHLRTSGGSVKIRSL
ncbi:MAG TPA: hypothetical protein VKG01_04040 [Thermoanaerobaculia bacterium]|nr:hypothetical protein [Thermoanaerobaculia bacterium]